MRGGKGLHRRDDCALRLPDIPERSLGQIVRVRLRLVVLPHAEGTVEPPQDLLGQLLPEVTAEPWAATVPRWSAEQPRCALSC